MKLHFIKPLVLVFCLSVSLAKSQSFTVKSGLLDQTNTATLGLQYADGVETYTVFTATSTSDHYSNNVELIYFKGYFYCQWQNSKTDEDSEDTWVAYSRSVDAKTWSAPMVMAKPVGTSYSCPGGWWVYGDSLLSFINVCESNVTPHGGVTYYRKSADGINWTPMRPVLMSDGSQIKGILEPDQRLLPNGRIIGAAHFQKGWICNPIYTDDPTATKGWKKSTYTNMTYTGDMTREIEPSYYWKSDNTLVMIFRDQTGTFRKLASTSTDNGKSWTTPVLTDMPDARTRQSAGNLPEGQVFMVGSPVDVNRRSPLAIALSVDGKTFDKAYLLRNGSTELPARRYTGTAKTLGYSYTKSMIHDGYLYVGYSVNKEDVAFTRVPISSLYKPSITMSAAITTPASGAVYTSTTNITFKATASISSGSILSVTFYDGANALGTATASGSTYSLTTKLSTIGTHSITAKAIAASGQTVISSAVQLSIANQPVTYVYNNASAGDWGATSNWTPQALPTANDTAIIRTGEAKLATDFAGYVKIEPNGILRASAFVNLATVELQGGAIKANTSNQTFGMKATFVVKEASSVISGTNPLTLFTLEGTISGSANLTKKDLGLVKVAATATNFKGLWIVAQDTLTIASASGLGQCGAMVETAVLDIDVAASTNALTVKKGGKLNLDANLTVQAAVLGDINIPAGAYTAAQYPAFISGSGTLTVAKSIATASTPSNGSITLSSNAGATYNWYNGTNSASTAASFIPLNSGAYTVNATNSVGCAITSAPIAVQAISLGKGWNLISTNVHSIDSTIVTLFKGLDVQEVKTMDAFWRKGQTDAFNGLQKLTAGEGYLVNMNIAGTLTVSGTPISSSNFQISTSSNWMLIGCPYQTATPFSTNFSTTNCSVIKNFEGFWKPNGSSNTFENIEPGKGYYLKK